ncbi:hypothetical protein J4405_03640 [Candidatus Woesearchaeota archaeon]|nr:hypothetical protein [Candidatus Woesearchaeota archaeon]
MNEKTLKDLALISSIIGIFLLSTINYYQEPSLVNISQINSSLINKEVEISANLYSIKETPGLYLLTFHDNNGSISAIIYKEENLTFQKNTTYLVKGKVIRYKSYLEIQASSIKK